MARHQALGVARCVGGLEVRQGSLSHFKPLPSFGRTRGGYSLCVYVRSHLAQAVGSRF